MEKVREDAEARRDKHRVSAGKALQAMRLRGESISSIAAQAGVSVAVVRGFLQSAAKDAPTVVADGGVGGERVAAVATRCGGGHSVAGVRRVVMTGPVRRSPPLWVDPVAHGGEIARFERFVVAGPSPADCAVFCGAIGDDAYGRN